MSEEVQERRARSLTFRDSAGWLLALGLATITLVSNYSANATRLQVSEQRIEKLETLKADHQEIADMKDRLQRIENKLDQLADERAERRGKK